MSSSGELGDLYQQLIIDHSKSPRNEGRPEGTNRTADGTNPLCGDRVVVHLVLDEAGSGRILDAGFQGSGCAISTASASMMTDAVRGKTPEEALRMFDEFRNLITGNSEAVENLGKLAVFSGVCEYPSRIKCAGLVWHAMKNALLQKTATATTEASEPDR